MKPRPGLCRIWLKLPFLKCPVNYVKMVTDFIDKYVSFSAVTMIIILRMAHFFTQSGFQLAILWYSFTYFNNSESSPSRWSTLYVYHSQEYIVSVLTNKALNHYFF